MDYLKTLWRLFGKIAFFIGNLISGIFLFVFYYSIFAVFAIPFRIFSRPLGKKSENSNWVSKRATPTKLEDFLNE